MNESLLLTWLENTAYGEAVRNISWLFPALEIVHFLGLCLLLGALLVIDLRLLGVTRQTPVGPAIPYIWIALIGFLLCAVSGIGFVCADPFNYASNWSFKLKLALIVIAGMNALAFEFLERRNAVALAAGADTNVRTKVIAGLSLFLWFSVLGLGRLLPYLGGYGG